MLSFKTILVPIDFCLHSQRAVDAAIDLAAQYHGTILLLHVWDFPTQPYACRECATLDPLPVEDEAKKELAEVLAAVKRRLPNVTSILAQGEAWRQILSVIKEVKPDLVVMGTHGRRGFDHYMLGSVAEKIVRTSPVPVLTLGLGADDASDAPSPRSDLTARSMLNTDV